MQIEDYLEKMKGFEQKNRYHDLDLYDHTMKAVNRAKELGYPEEVVEALLWHDVGKLTCNQMWDDGYQHYNGHEIASAKAYADSFGRKLDSMVYKLVFYHDIKLTSHTLNSLGIAMSLVSRENFVRYLLMVKECDAYAHNDYAKEKGKEPRKKEIALANEYLRKWRIERRVQEHYDELVKCGYEIVGVFLQGSQNYNLDYEGSDIDTKAIVLPSFEDFVAGKAPVSTTIVLDNNEHIDVKDIRVMFDCFVKSNINFLEILFTKYRILNKKYSALIAPLFINKERIALYDMKRLLNACCGMCMEKYKALKHPYPNTVAEIELRGYSAKQLHHIFRLNEFVRRLIAGESFARCLVSKDAEHLVNIKRGCMTLEEAEKSADELTKATHDAKVVWQETTETFVDDGIHEILLGIKYAILKQWFAEQVDG